MTSSAILEQYVFFKPVSETPQELAWAKVCDADFGLEVRVKARDSSRILVLRFGRVPAFKVTLEECRLLRFHGEWEDPISPMSVFTVQNSEWASKFSEAELVLYPNSVHYVFMSDDQIVEVLSDREPEAEWADAGQ